MMKRFSPGAVIALMAITAAITISITYTVAMRVFNERVYSVTERQLMYDKVYEIDQQVRQNYSGSIDENQLRDHLAQGYLEGLGDSHSKYLTADEYAALSDSLAGKAYGIGIEVEKNDEGNIIIYSVITGSPAESAGIKKGDIITRVGSERVSAMGYEKALNELSSSSSPKAIFTLRRGGKDIAFEITKSQYEAVTVDYKVIENIGYVYIKEFNDKTFEQFQAVVSDLISQDIQGFVFDVRNNTGGQLNAACKCLDMLLPAGNLVTSVDKSGKATVEYVSNAKEVNMPMVVIVNEKTASAAELFAAALRDRRSSEIVGVKTVGKGTLQKTFALSDGSALSLTVATFNPPVSKSFNKTGITPDFEVKLNDSTRSFHLMEVEEDNQLQTAIDIINTKISPIENGDENSVDEPISEDENEETEE